jgi:ABC-type lipoprotein release transport system permease subunit
MRAALDTLRMVLLIAFRNLLASRLKTAIVGGIIFFGALLVVLGTSLLDSIDASMSRSIIGSVAGHIQVYSADSKDELEVMSGFNLEGSDLAELDYAHVRKTLLSVPNVAQVVPMGISGAIVTSGNTIDLALADLRELVRKRGAGEGSGALEEEYQSRKAHVRQMVKVLEGDLENMAQLEDERALSPENVEAVRRAASDEFWQTFDAAPLEALEFLENRIAPEATDADMLFLRYVGTDPDAFARSFDRMKIVEGTAIPRGQRGFLFAKFTYEDQIKLKTARRLDKIKQAIDNRGVQIATNPELQQFVRENSTQVRELLLQLDSRKTALFRKKLQKELGSAEEDVGKLLSSFFQTTDDNFPRRYRFFYDELAPSLELYRVRVGDTLTIKAFTRTGYVQSINLKVYGTFTFEGLESSPQAGILNLMDLVSFRELYGFQTEEKQKEIESLKASVGAKEVSRDRAEAELFGSRSDTEAEGEIEPVTAADADAALAALAGRARRDDRRDGGYAPRQLEEGVILNAAVLLKDPRRIPQTVAEIEAAGQAAGLPLKAISWQKASGLVGQFVTLARIVLYTAVLIIFVVALVIINNALVMATLERVQEIGTLRAVGAQRRFVLSMLLVEALAIGALFGALGAAAGAGLVALIGKVGIPAINDIFTFFFSGPRLYPTLGATSLGVALGIVLLVSALSSLYPAWLAMRVSPRQAMATEE